MTTRDAHIVRSSTIAPYRVVIIHMGSSFVTPYRIVDTHTVSRCIRKSSYSTKQKYRKISSLCQSVNISPESLISAVSGTSLTLLFRQFSYSTKDESRHYIVWIPTTVFKSRPLLGFCEHLAAVSISSQYVLKLMLISLHPPPSYTHNISRIKAKDIMSGQIPTKSYSLPGAA